MKTNQMLSERLKHYRKALDMTQEEFAAAIGVESQHISAIERGSKGISVEKLMEICKKFSLKLDDLLPTDECDDTLKEKLIIEIAEHLHTLDVVQVGILKRMIRSLRG